MEIRTCHKNINKITLHVLHYMKAFNRIHVGNSELHQGQHLMNQSIIV